MIAAGNDGPGESTVGSPGSADAALTVGAVDKQDQLATPHTAGAAAILAQVHPDWRAAELKGALTGSAKPAAGQTAFDQGAGRIDVAKGIKQSVIAEPGNLSFGTAVWPHDDDTPVTKTLTYRNLGDQPVTLNLTASLTGPDGNPAPADALQLSANTATVSAGGTASVQVTSNTKHTGPDGGYSGRITATAGDNSVTSAIGVNKEPESYNLTVSAIGPDGKPAPAEGVLFGLSRDLFSFVGDGSDTLTMRLPKGEYLVEGDQFIETEDSVTSYAIVQPSIQLTEDTTIVFDARQAKPVKVSVPQAGAAVALGDIGYDRASADGRFRLGSSTLVNTFDGAYTAQLGAALPPEQLTGHVASQLADPGADGAFRNTPYLYGQVNAFPGLFPTGFERAVRARDLGVVEQTVNATGDRGIEKIATGTTPGMNGSWSPILEFDSPVKTELLVDAAPATWTTLVQEVQPSSDPEFPFPDTITGLGGPSTAYRAGKTYHERFNAAAFTFGPSYAGRLEGDLFVSASGLTDADGNSGFTATDSESSKLIRDGQVVAESPYFVTSRRPGCRRRRRRTRWSPRRPGRRTRRSAPGWICAGRSPRPRRPTRRCCHCSACGTSRTSTVTTWPSAGRSPCCRC